jgi:hypothetical protein
MTQAETRILGYAIAGSLAVHLLLAFTFALWIGLFSFQHIHFSTPPVEDEQPDVTLVFPEPPPPPPAPAPPPDVTPQRDAQYVRTTQNTEAPQAPAKADFISDKNTVAMSKAPGSPDGDKPLPTMQGVNYATTELADRSRRSGDLPQAVKSSPPPDGATPVATSPPPEIANKEPAQEIRAIRPTMRTPEEKSVPHAIPTAAPVSKAKSAEEDAFQSKTRRSAVNGSLGNVGGEDAVNAAATPRGRFESQAKLAIEQKWVKLTSEHPEVLDPGKLGVRFYINKHGKVENLKVVFNEATVELEEIAKQAILAAEIPPIPNDLLPMLENGRLPVDYDVVIAPKK